MAPPKGKSAGGTLEGLKSVFQQLSSLQLEPDSQEHMQFLQAIQQAIMKYIQMQTQKKAQQAAQMQMMQSQQASQMNGQMGGPHPGGGGPPPGASQGQPGGPPSQGMPGLAMPNPDELRRMLATQGAGG